MGIESDQGTSTGRMPFGKYRGWFLSEVPGDYLEWLSSLDTLRDPLRTAVEQEYQRRLEEEAQRAAQRLPADPAVVETASALITAGYRSLAHRHHPDHGGDHQTMVRVNTAAAWLRTIMEQVTQS